MHARKPLDRVGGIHLHQREFGRNQRRAVVAATVAIIVGLSIMPQGTGEGRLDGTTTFDTATETESFEPATGWLAQTAIWAGAAAGYVMLMSPVTAHRPLLRRWLPVARWRRIHVAIGLGILVFAAAHAIALVAMGAFYTWPSGVAGFVALAMHGASGALKNRLVPAIGVRRWRYVHIATGWIGLTMGLEHALGMNLAQEMWGG